MIKFRLRVCNGYLLTFEGIKYIFSRCCTHNMSIPALLAIYFKLMEASNVMKI